MVRPVKATYRDGVLEPSESLDLEDGESVQRLRRIRESVPASAWDDVPSDGGKNYKHYLYGHPKAD